MMVQNHLEIWNIALQVCILSWLSLEASEALLKVGLHATYKKISNVLQKESQSAWREEGPRKCC